MSEREKIKVPARIIYQLETEIARVEKQIAKQQDRLAQLKDAREQMEKDRP